MRTTGSSTFFLAVLLAGNLSSSAQLIIYNSFGPSFSYDTSTAWGVGGASVSGGYRGQAEFFTPSVSCYLSQVKLETYHVSGSRLSNFFIAEDSGFNTPGNILESFNNVTTPTGLLTLTSVVDPQLTAGTQYWLCMEPSTDTSYNAWFYNNQNVASGFAYERGQWSWSFFPPPSPKSGVFEILATPVPEPAPLAIGLLVSALVGIRVARSH